MDLSAYPFVDDPAAIGRWEVCSVVNNPEDFNEASPAVDEYNSIHEIYFLPNGQGYWIFEYWTKGTIFIGYGADSPWIPWPYTIKEINGTSYLFVTIPDEKVTLVLKQVSREVFAKDQIGRRESIDLPFQPDPNVLGEWRSVDFVSNPEQFDPNHQQCSTLYLTNMIFYPDGSVLRNYMDIQWHDKWTKGFLLDQKHRTVNGYEIRTIDGTDYLLMQWKMGNYIYNLSAPDYYVFRRA